MNTLFDTKINYVAGGIEWTFDLPFSQPPVVCVGIQLNAGGLEDNIYPLSHKIISLTATSVIIKVYKAILDLSDIIFKECETNDVVVHITAEGE
jgi:hypothetical protein